MMEHTLGNPYGTDVHLDHGVYDGLYHDKWEEGYRYATEKMQGRTADNPYCIHVKYEADEDSRRRQWKREGWEVGYHSRDEVVADLLDAANVARNLLDDLAVAVRAISTSEIEAIRDHVGQAIAKAE